MRQRSERKKKRHQVTAIQIEREAVRAVLTPEAFAKVERLRDEFTGDGEPEERFWAMAREQMVRSARVRPDFAEKIMRAKTGGVGAMLGLATEQIDRLLSQIDFPRFVQAALTNAAVLAFQNEPKVAVLWTERAVRESPPLRVEFEHAVVFGAINEAGDIAKSKSWGTLLALKPLEQDDRLYPNNISYMLKSTSKQRMRWEFRDTFRNVLGAKRALVSEALRSSKEWFLGHLDRQDAMVIREKLDIEPGDFWRMVRYGERFGPDGIVSFMRALEEKTRGYRLPFQDAGEGLVQIQLAPAATLDRLHSVPEHTQ